MSVNQNNPLREKDLFLVSSKTMFYDVDLKTIIFLYQPLLNSNAISLYLFLINISNTYFAKNEMKNNYLYHNYILSTLRISLEEFVIARKLLESTLLIQTYVDYDEILKENFYHISINPPLTPNKLLKGRLFQNKLLLNLGENNLNITKNLFKLRYKNKTLGDNISSEINDIVNMVESEIINDEYEYVSRDKKEIKLISYDWLERILKNKVDEKEWKTNTKLFELIENLHYIYSMSYETIFILIEQSIDNRKIDVKKMASISNKYINKKLMGYIIDENDENFNNMISTNALSVRERMIMHSNIEYYILTYKEIPSKGTLNQISKLMNKYKMSYELVNCLMDFSYIKNKKLVLNYIEKIAQTIKDKNLYNINDLMLHLNKSLIKNKYNMNDDESETSSYDENTRIIAF